MLFFCPFRAFLETVFHIYECLYNLPVLKPLMKWKIISHFVCNNNCLTKGRRMQVNGIERQLGFYENQNRGIFLLPLTVT